MKIRILRAAAHNKREYLLQFAVEFENNATYKMRLWKFVAEMKTCSLYTIMCKIVISKN